MSNSYLKLGSVSLRFRIRESSPMYFGSLIFPHPHSLVLFTLSLYFVSVLILLTLMYVIFKDTYTKPPDE